jgi:hypothetical protein
MTDALPLDELIARLRERAADPARRTTSRPSELTAEVRTLDLGGLLSMGRSLGGQLRAVVDANRAGRVDEAGVAAARDLERRMETPAPSILPAPADDEWITTIEGRLDVALPSALRRVYAEVADGGFGPGEGILPLAEIVTQYEELTSPGMLPRGRTWPEGLLPLVAMDPGWDCVDASTGRVVAWDPEDLDERVSDRRWAASFRTMHGTVEAWLTDWLGSRTAAEVREIELASMRRTGAWTHIRALQGLSEEQRASFGLAPGWEPEMAARMGVPWPPPDDSV